MSRAIMALVQISYGKLAESLVRALLPTFLLTPFRVETVTYSNFLFYNIPLNSSNFPTSKPKIKKKSRFLQLIIVVGVVIKGAITDLSVTKCGITPCENVLHVESRILEIFACVIRNPGPWNPECTYRNPESH